MSARTPGPLTGNGKAFDTGDYPLRLVTALVRDGLVIAHVNCGIGTDGLVEARKIVKACNAYDTLEALANIVSDHVATLESCGFGGDPHQSINGGDAVDAVNDHFEKLRTALAAARAAVQP